MLNPILLTAICAVVSFFIGAIPFGLILGRVFNHTDIRKAGSGNIGTTNALRVAGPKVAALTHLQQRGVKAGVVLNPATPVCVLESIIDVVDMVLLMSVNPGFGGQSFIPGTIAKLHELKAMCERHGVSPLIEVDGGISSKNIAEVVKAGANVLVAGSAVFKSEDPAAEVALLQKLGNEAAQEA